MYCPTRTSKRSDSAASRMLSLLVVLFTCFAVNTPSCAFADRVGKENPAGAVRAEYIRLRNVDPTGDNPAEHSNWDALSRRIDHLLNGLGDGVDSFRYRIYAADVHLRLWRYARIDAAIARASRVLEPVLRSEDSPKDLYDALMLRGDIALGGEGAPEKARRFYERALEVATEGGVRAQERLQGIDNDTFSALIPSPDMEVPRLLPRRFRKRTAEVRTVVLDPGHGGDDPGAVGHGGITEKEITLDVARRVERILSSSYGVRVILTREHDSFTPLARRTAYANRREADVFVSLHVNATPSHQLHGLETYYLDNTDDAASRRLAERENGVAPGENLDDLSFILSDLIQSGKLEDSIRLSHMLDSNVMSRIGSNYPSGRSLGVKKAPFFVLVGAHMPCALLEMFFVDHPADGAKLSDSRFRQFLADGVAQGIKLFLDGGGRSL